MGTIIINLVVPLAVSTFLDLGATGASVHLIIEPSMDVEACSGSPCLEFPAPSD